MQTFWSPGHQPPQRANDRHAGSASPYGFVYVGTPAHSHSQQQPLYAQRVIALRPELQQRPLLEQQLQLQQQQQSKSLQSQPFAQQLQHQRQQVHRRIAAPGLEMSLPLETGDPMRAGIGSGQQLSSMGLSSEGGTLPPPVSLYDGSRRQYAGSAQALTSLQLSRLVPVPIPGMPLSPHSPAAAGPTPVQAPFAPRARTPAASVQQGAIQTQIYSSVVPPLQAPGPLSTFAPAPANLVYSQTHSHVTHQQQQQQPQQQQQQVQVQQYGQSLSLTSSTLSASPPLVQQSVAPFIQQPGQSLSGGPNPVFLVDQPPLATESKCGPLSTSVGTQQGPIMATSSSGSSKQSPMASPGGTTRLYVSTSSNGRGGAAGGSPGGGGGSSNSGTPTPSQSSAVSGRSSLSSYDGISSAVGGSARSASTTHGPTVSSSSHLNLLQLLRGGVSVQ